MAAGKVLAFLYAVLVFGFLFISCATDLAREWRRNPDRRVPLGINLVLSGFALLAFLAGLAESIGKLLPDTNTRSYEAIAEELFPGRKPSDSAEVDKALDELFPASSPRK